MRPLFIFTGSIAVSMLLAFCIPQQQHDDRKAENCTASKQGNDLFVAFYNVENLFDTTDDPGIDDAEFLPTAKNPWTNDKYKTKVSNIARVIRTMNDGDGADIVGLAEVENIGVVKDLVSDPQLKNLDYEVVHHESPDTRGIDVAMIYKKKSLKVIGTRFFHVDISKYEEKPTRDIVLVKGIDNHKDTLFIFLNHWPSRRGGTEQSKPRREVAATVLRKAVDSIQLASPGAKMIIMGDFNDNPTDASISDILKATKTADPSSKNSLYDAANVFNWKAGEGSEWYRGEWSRFIQIILSPSLIKNQLAADGTFHDIHLFKPDWLLTSDSAYHQTVPYRTFESGKPIGFSDHLPVYVVLHF